MRRRLILAGVALLLSGAALPAQRSEPTPDELAGVGITEKLGTQVPLDLAFRDEQGREVRLRDYFTGQRPVIITLNYARCPMLCKLQLEGFVEGLQELAWTPGKDFEIVTVSIDPKESTTQARFAKQRYIETYGRPEAAAGWHFLTGADENIHALADALGFGYRFVPETGEFAHTAALMLASPTGKLCRYLYGVRYGEATLRLGLVEAGEGKVGSTLDHFLLFCFRYDSAAGKYTVAAYGLMRLGAVITAIALAIIIFGVRRRARDRTPVPAELGA